MKKIVILVLIVFGIIYLTSCVSIDALKGMRDACLNIYDFWDAVKTDDIDKARSMLHPNSDILLEGLENYLSTIENEIGITFSDDLYIQDDHTMISANQNFQRAYVTQCYLVIDNKAYFLSILTVDDEDGFGIYSFIVEPYKN